MANERELKHTSSDHHTPRQDDCTDWHQKLDLATASRARRYIELRERSDGWQNRMVMSRAYPQRARNVESAPTDVCVYLKTTTSRAVDCVRNSCLG